MDGGETRITSCEKKRVVCEFLVNPTTKQPFVMKSASIDFTLKSVSFFMLGKLKLRITSSIGSGSGFKGVFYLS